MIICACNSTWCLNSLSHPMSYVLYILPFELFSRFKCVCVSVFHHAVRTEEHGKSVAIFPYKYACSYHSFSRGGCSIYWAAGVATHNSWFVKGYHVMELSSSLHPFFTLSFSICSIAPSSCASLVLQLFNTRRKIIGFFLMQVYLISKFSQSFFSFDITMLGCLSFSPLFWSCCKALAFSSRYAELLRHIINYYVIKL